MALMAITPHIKDLENFLTNCHLRRHLNRSTIIYEGDTATRFITSSKVPYLWCWKMTRVGKW
jgi:hypothetical protein